MGGAVTALLTAGLALIAASPASAASSAGPASAPPQPLAGVGRQFDAAANPSSVRTGTADYSCDFSNYGTGIPAATVTAGWQVNDSWPVNNPDDIILLVPNNGTLPLPSQVSSQLSSSGVDSFGVQATVQATVQGTAKTVTVTGDTTGTALPNPLTQVPRSPPKAR